MTTTLEVTPEEYEKMRVSECILVVGYVNESGDWTRTWVEAVGAREECEEVLGLSGLFIVPNGLKLQSEIVSVADVAPPSSGEGE